MKDIKNLLEKVGRENEARFSRIFTLKGELLLKLCRELELSENNARLLYIALFSNDFINECENAVDLANLNLKSIDLNNFLIGFSVRLNEAKRDDLNALLLSSLSSKARKFYKNFYEKHKEQIKGVENG